MMGTPTYMLNMANVAKNQLGIDPAALSVSASITCAGEPGASIPSTKARLHRERLGGQGLRPRRGHRDRGLELSNAPSSPAACT